MGPGRLFSLFATLALGLLAMASAAEPKIGGELIIEMDGRRFFHMPHKTRVQVAISGDTAVVYLTQHFANPFDTPLEAAYTLPLSHEAAVTQMDLQVGERQINGVVLERSQAKETYDEVVAKGQTAGLLSQTRDNVFQQHIGNIPPKGEVVVFIRTQEMVAFDDGQYEFHFPLAVRERYEPGARQSTVDAVSPVAAAPRWRDRASLSVTASLDTGLPLAGLSSPSHDVSITGTGVGLATVALKAKAQVANEDFVLRWSLPPQVEPEASLQLHRPFADLPGYFQLTVHPGQLSSGSSERLPRDICFLLDTSGSMGQGPGSPLAQAKAAVSSLIRELNEKDRLQLVSFAGGSIAHFDDFISATPGNKTRVLRIVADRPGGGGTNMLDAFRHALRTEAHSTRTRIVVLLSDGFIGDEQRIFDLVREEAQGDTRFVGIGIGNSVNRLLFDGIEDLGAGLAKVLLMGDDPAATLAPLMQRLQQAQLKDITIDTTGAIELVGLNRDRVGSLFPGRPLVVLGRYQGDGPADIIVSGSDETNTAKTVRISAEWPEQRDEHHGIATRWARERIRCIERQRIAVSGVKEIAVRDLALAFQIVSSQTSFVAVEPSMLDERLTPLRDALGEELPEGIAARNLLRYAADRNVVASLRGTSQAFPADGLASPMNQQEPLLTDLLLGEIATEDEIVAAVAVTGRAEAMAVAEMGGSGSFMAIGASGGASGSFGSRSGGGKKRALGKYGGSRSSESAVERGLRYLANHQQANGSILPYHFTGLCTPGGPLCPQMPVLPAAEEQQRQVLLTSKVLLCFLGAGYDHRTPNKYRKHTKEMIGFLNKEAGPEQSGRFSQGLVAQATATQAIAEAYAMTNDPALRRNAQNAVDILRDRQQADGSFAHPVAEGVAPIADTVLTLRAVLALKTAKTAGLDVHDALEKARDWHDRVSALCAQDQTMNGRWPATVSKGTELGEATLRSDASGLALKIFLGVSLDSPGAKALADTVLAAEAQLGNSAPLARYFSTIALFQFGGRHWQAWNGAQRDRIISAQDRSGTCQEGSWMDIDNLPEDLAPLGHIGLTCLRDLTLQTYYTYLPINRK